MAIFFQGCLRHCDNELNEKIASNMDSFELGIALDNVTDFIWNEYCDWYIEMVKPRLYGEDPASKEAALWTLKTVLVDSLKLLHPFMPFITEEIFDSLTDEESIMISEYPKKREEFCFKAEENSIENVKSAVRAVRTVRKEMDVPVKKKAQVFILAKDRDIASTFDGAEDIFGLLCGASGLSVTCEASDIPDNSVSAVIDGATVYMPLSELVDTEKERARLLSEKDRLLSELKRSESMLSNERFISKAPAAKVEEERQKKLKYEDMLKTVEERLSSL